MYSLFTTFHLLTAFAKYLVSVKDHLLWWSKISISGLAHSFGVHAAFLSSLHDGFSCFPGCFLSLFNTALDLYFQYNKNIKLYINYLILCLILLCVTFLLFILVWENKDKVLVFFCVLLGTVWEWNMTAKATAAGMKLPWEAWWLLWYRRPSIDTTGPCAADRNWKDTSSEFVFPAYIRGWTWCNAF